MKLGHTGEWKLGQSVHAATSTAVHHSDDNWLSHCTQYYKQLIISFCVHF